MSDSNAKKLAQLLDGNGDVLLDNLDNISVTPASVSDQSNTSTGAFDIPSGTTAERPESPNVGYIRFNTDDTQTEIYDGTEWIAVSSTPATLSSVTGTIYAGIVGSDLTLTGSGFLEEDLVVNFSQSSDGIDEDVTVTPASDTSASVTVPSAVYSNLTAGNVVTITVTNSDGLTSGGIDKTAVDIPSGGTITTSGDYRIHTFTSSSSLVVPSGFSADVEYLVIGGGGSSGSGDAGLGSAGGGAGGYRSSVSGESSGGGASAESVLSVSSGSYTVTIGAGGTAPAATELSMGTNGSDTTFDSITSLGGGGGATFSSDGLDGGSGGGAAGRNNNTTGGSGTSGQGYAGGDGNIGQGDSSTDAGGGGGGAGGLGEDASDYNGGDGGDGVQSSIDGTATYRAGGGGGASEAGTQGSGGLGGGGDANASGSTGGNGTPNTGSGAGGAGSESNNQGGNGGSGVVIVRYDTTSV